MRTQAWPDSEAKEAQLGKTACNGSGLEDGVECRNGLIYVIASANRSLASHRLSMPLSGRMSSILMDPYLGEHDDEVGTLT